MTTTVLMVGAAASLLVGSEPSRSVDAPSMAGGSHLSISRIEIYSGVDGVESVVFEFDGALPDDRLTYVQDIIDFDAPGIAYTTQEYTPEDPVPLWTCGDKHFGFSPPATVGQVDVLLPAAWFGAAPPRYEDIPVEHHGGSRTSKTVLCGLDNGFIQFAIWSPSSHDPADVQVLLDGRSRLIVKTHRASC